MADFSPRNATKNYSNGSFREDFKCAIVMKAGWLGHGRFHRLLELAREGAAESPIWVAISHSCSLLWLASLHA